MILLNLLQGVRKTGNRAWVARCPNHEDRMPSLSVRETDDGRWLLHCFAGCETYAVLAALGLEMTDLYPQPLAPHLPRVRSRVSASDALRSLANEATVIALMASDLAEGKPVDAARAAKAAGRIAEALEVTRG